MGDFTATSLGMGYLASGLFFFGVILLPAIAWRRFGLNSIAAFWMAYIVTRPLGASFADWISKPANLTGLNFGNGRTAVLFAVATFILVSYLAIARPDIQRPIAESTEDRQALSSTPETLDGASEIELG